MKKKTMVRIIARVDICSWENMPDKLHPKHGCPWTVDVQFTQGPDLTLRAADEKSARKLYYGLIGGDWNEPYSIPT